MQPVSEPKELQFTSQSQGIAAPQPAGATQGEASLEQQPQPKLDVDIIRKESFQDFLQRLPALHIPTYDVFALDFEGNSVGLLEKKGGTPMAKVTEHELVERLSQPEDYNTFLQVHFRR
jgi:hypothetical protein